MQYFYLQMKYMQSLSEQTEFEHLKMQFKELGINFYIGKDQLIKNPSFIEIGDNFFAMDRVRIEAWDEYGGQKFTPPIKIGNNVRFNSDIHIGAVNNIVIGDNYSTFFGFIKTNGSI